MDIKVQVPNQLNEITLAQYRKYLEVANTNADDPNADTFVSMKMLEIFCNVPYDKTKFLKFKDVAHIVGILADMLNSKPDLVKSFKIGETEFGFIPDLEDMSFGEYVDLDTSIGDWDKMHTAMAVLYRPIVQKYGGKYRVAEYEPELYEEAMKHAPMDAVISSLVFFLQFRDRIVDSYDELFAQDGGDGLSSESTFGRKWGWYQSIYALAGGDITRFDDITSQGLHKCLTMLAFEKEKTDLENMRMKSKFKQ